MKNNLYKSPVTFKEETHQYFLNGKQLFGITGYIDTILFGGKYKKMKEDPKLGAKLEAAGAYGTSVHKNVETYCMKKSLRRKLVKQYKEVEYFDGLAKVSGITPLICEYLVSDEKFIASSIDLVDTEYNLYDFKTVANMDKEYIARTAVQLSVYARLFEINNPGLQAGKLFIVNLRHKEKEDGKIEKACKLIEVERYSDEFVDKFLVACSFGEGATMELPEEKQADIAPEIISEVIRTREALSVAEKAKKEAEANFLKALKDSGCKSYSSEELSYSKSAGYLSYEFDEALFAAEHPAMYARYVVSKKTNGRSTFS